MTYEYPDGYDVIVVGAGHAGCEAALAAARIGARVLVLTGSLEMVAQMSCNPAIGGVAKGHIVKEIDALGGEMASVIDQTGIQFRRLNASKGPAVRSTRAQADKRRYRDEMRMRLERCERLALRQGEVAQLHIDGGRPRVVGVTTTIGVRYRASAVILTTGTFLRGAIFVGEARAAGGRAGEAPAVSLSHSLDALGFPLARLKTGTPCRLDRRTLDVSGLELQYGDDPPPMFRWHAGGGAAMRPPPPLPQVPCWITYTNERTHAIIRDGLPRSPLYRKDIQGTGPRYCPSIEDKIVRFADKERHQIFLEPEGVEVGLDPKWNRGELGGPAGEVYPNGISTSLPFDPVESEHATHVAGIAAGDHDTTAVGDFGPAIVSGIAPRAYLGNYRIGTIPTNGVGLDGRPQVARVERRLVVALIVRDEGFTSVDAIRRHG
jgi:tRNA uridine 5-carboxymethylaminomethyl modification enzyme